MTYEEALRFLDEHCTASVIPFEVKIKCSEALAFRSNLNKNAKLLLSSDYNSKEAKLFWSDLMEMME